MSKFIRFRLDLSGIYGWGTGFYSRELADKWDTALAELEKNDGNRLIFWHITHDDNCHYGVSTYGHMFIHPMEITGAIEQIGKNSVKSKVSEIVKIGRYLLESCGLSADRLNLSLWEAPAEYERETTLDEL